MRYPFFIFTLIATFGFALGACRPGGFGASDGGFYFPEVIHELPDDIAPTQGDTGSDAPTGDDARTGEAQDGEAGEQAGRDGGDAPEGDSGEAGEQAGRDGGTPPEDDGMAGGDETPPSEGEDAAPISAYNLPISGEYTGGTVQDFIGDDEANDFTLNSADSSQISGYIDLGGGEDTLTIAQGCYAAYRGWEYPSEAAEHQGEVDCDGDGGSDTRPIIYGGLGADSFMLSGGVIGVISGEDDEGDEVHYAGGIIRGNIDLQGGNDELTLSVAEPVDNGNALADEARLYGYVSMGEGDDVIILEDGCYAGYLGGLTFIREGTVDCDGDDTTPDEVRGYLNAGMGSDELQMNGGVLGSILGEISFGFLGENLDDTITYTGGTIWGNIELQGGNDFLGLKDNTALTGDDDERIHGYVDMGEDFDGIVLLSGCYGAYRGGDLDGDSVLEGAAQRAVDCDGAGEGGEVMRAALYGGADVDLIVLIGGVIEFLEGEEGEDDIFRLLAPFGDSMDDPFPEIAFAGDCSPSLAGDQWICDGGTSDHDVIQYGPDVTALAATAQSGIEHTCELEDFFSTDCDAQQTSLATRGTFAIGIEAVSVSPALGLWGGLSSAMRSFGREMMEDFTSSFSHPASPSALFQQGFALPKHAMDTGESVAIQRLHPCCAEPSITHLFTSITHSNGAFHAQQTRLRGESTSHLTLQGVPGATGTSSYTHDVNLIQHGFSTSVAQGLTAQGDLHIMQGNLASSDGADQFAIEGYGAGMKLNYGMADIAMLGAWFDLSSDDWGRPMAFSGTQWIVSAGLEHEITFGAAKLIPQARGFWQKTSIEEQGAISFSDDLIFTGKVGLAAQAGNHALDVFFTRDDDASSLNTGLVQNHRMEQAIEAGWRNTMLADDYSLAGEVRFRHGLETSTDSYSIGLAFARAF